MLCLPIRRQGYLADADAERLIGRTKQTFACLHGLIKAVEREAGKISNMATPITTLLVLGLPLCSLLSGSP
jgi:hypothetical protein